MHSALKITIITIISHSVRLQSSKAGMRSISPQSISLQPEVDWLPNKNCL